MSVLVIVDDFNFLRSLIRPNKTYAVTLIHADAVLPGSITYEYFESIAGVVRRFSTTLSKLRQA